MEEMTLLETLIANTLPLTGLGIMFMEGPGPEPLPASHPAMTMTVDERYTALRARGYSSGVASSLVYSNNISDYL